MVEVAIAAEIRSRVVERWLDILSQRAIGTIEVSFGFTDSDYARHCKHYQRATLHSRSR